MGDFVMRFLRCEQGRTAIEYALVTALITACLVSALNVFAVNLKRPFAKAYGAMPQ